MIKSLFSFRGRARRSEWWGVGIAVGLLSYAMDPILEGDPSLLVSVIVLVLSVLMIWASIATNTRRCHDLGHNGFWQLIPFYGIWMGFVKGNIGSNEYGVDPTEATD